MAPPGGAELVVPPGVVDGEQREVVPLGLVELGLPLVSDRLGEVAQVHCPVPHLLLLWPVEDILDGEHGDDGEDLVAAAEVHRHDQHLREVRLQGELGHPPPQPGDKSFQHWKKNDIRKPNKSCTW